MNDNKVGSFQCEIYENSINILLFNKIVSFVVETTNNKQKSAVLSNIDKYCIWFDKIDISNIQEELKFEYLGELLERFEERVGNDIKDLRAIALALGYSKVLIESNMIIGTQLIDFLNKVKGLSENDIYLKGALYLYDNQKYNYAADLVNKKNMKKEEIVFVLSVFKEGIEDVFKQKKEQLSNLFGKDRTISPIGNMRVYAWLLKNIYPLISKNKKKDEILLRALTKISTGYQKEDSSTYKELIENGYGQKEIAYMNYVLIFFDAVPRTFNIGNSIVEEKIAIKMCKVFLNDKDEQTEETYKILSNAILKYNYFKIKCYGFSGIREALKNEVNIVNPITFIKFYQMLERKLYSFNILEDKWNVVAERMDEKTYQELFDSFLLYGNYDKEQINKCIEKYDKLTGKKYLESFYGTNNYRDGIFALLVRKEIIDLKEYFEKVKDSLENDDRNYLANYIKGIHNRKSFDLLKYVSSLDKYNIEEINEIGFDFKRLYSLYRYEADRININREFLSDEEQILLFNYIENYIFKVETDDYIKFLEIVLKSKNVQRLFPKDKLREIFLTICEIEPEIYKDEHLQSIYLTSEEIEGIKEKERQEKEKERQIAENKLRDEAEKEFEKLPKNTFKDLYNFLDECYWERKKNKIRMDIVLDYIFNNIRIYSKEIENIKYLIKITNICVCVEEATAPKVLKILSEYLKEEVAEYGNFDVAC